MSGSKRVSSGSSAKGGAKRKKGTEQEIVPIYARLPKGPHSLGPSGVAHNQRIRIHGGMIEAVTTRGYDKTSVRLVIGLAGVSRRAFYEQFSGKEDCFLETFDLIVNRGVQRLTHAYRTAGGPPEKRMRVALEALGGELEQNSKALHLAMIDAQTAGAEGLRRLQRTIAVSEGLLSSAFSDRRYPDALPLPVLRAVVGGLRRVTFMRLRDGETEDLSTLMREMLKWSMVFKSPAVQELRPRLCATPPFPKVLKLEPDACGGESIRARLLRSAIELGVREERFEDLSSVRIADYAQLPPEAFMDLYPTPTACYVEALDVLGDELLQLVADPGLVSTEWSAAVCRTIDALLEYLAGSPARLVTLATKAPEAGPRGVASVGDLAYEVATLLTEGAPRRPRTRVAVEGIAGALWQILHGEVVAGRGHLLPILSEYVAYVVLTPFLGPEVAVQAIAQSRAPNADAEGAQIDSAASRDADPAGTRPGGVPTEGTRTNGSRLEPIPGGGAWSNGAGDGHGPASNNGATRVHRATPAENGTANGHGTPAGNGDHNGHGTAAGNGAARAQAASNGNGASTTNGSDEAEEDYRRLRGRRSATYVNSTPMSTDTTITTIKGA